MKVERLQGGRSTNLDKELERCSEIQEEYRKEVENNPDDYKCYLVHMGWNDWELEKEFIRREMRESNRNNQRIVEYLGVNYKIEDDVPEGQLCTIQLRFEDNVLTRPCKNLAVYKYIHEEGEYRCMEHTQ